MKKLMAVLALGGLTAAPLTFAQAVPQDIELALEAAVKAGVTQIRSLERDDDGRYPVEIEGWIGDEQYVELEIDRNGRVGRGQRNANRAVPNGLTVEEVRSYLARAADEGIEYFEEISLNRWGGVEVDGLDDRGRELDLEFRRDNSCTSGDVIVR